ncbi:hypothetical protein WHR41_00598 [Cladosporium halotolerans]|uniref:BAR domain-containing protein n=1 Tax=Cladosporium halotolerans TaxID=1052096 RepID=A0AB34L621_9PEZI
MNVNKKFDRFKQWGRERMGSEVKTDSSEDFKMLEIEMQLRQEGMERLNQSTNGYIKSISRRDQGEGKDKQLPVGHFASVLVNHGEDFEPDSEFGQCLTQLGRANERIARMQETYVANATSSWIEGTERSLAQMKEYQKSKQKLESRRLALDTAQVKLQKSKREDFRAEEELRSQKAKYEESSEEVYRRMFDIKEAEADSIADLTAFLEAELTYYDRCREVLMQIRRDWPSTAQPISRSGAASPIPNPARRPNRSRSNTASSLSDRFSRIMEEPPLDPPAKISSRIPSGQNSPRRELPGYDFSTPATTSARPIPSRSFSGFEGPTSLGSTPRDASPMRPLSRVPTDSSQISSARSNLRAVKSKDSGYAAGNVFDDGDSDGAEELVGSNGGDWAAGKKAPPPPPPSRAKKPPPPPPMKRSALSTSEVPQY